MERQLWLKDTTQWSPVSKSNTLLTDPAQPEVLSCYTTVTLLLPLSQKTIIFHMAIRSPCQVNINGLHQAFEQRTHFSWKDSFVTQRSNVFLYIFSPFHQ